MITPHDSIVVQMISRLLVPFIQLFGLYVFFHGHHSPGGGFQAGVLIGGSLILKLLVGSREELTRAGKKNELPIAVLGMTIYAGIGILALLGGAPYLDYGSISLFGNVESFRRFLGILGVELGVMLVVAMTLVIIFRVLALGEEEP